MWRKFKSHFTRAGGSRIRGGADSLWKKSSVNEEYMEAFRTKSYLEIHSKVEAELMMMNNEPHQLPSSDLLDPSPETLNSDINIHHLLIDYFKASSEACKSCETLLLRIRQTRANYQLIKRAIKLAKRPYDDQECDTARELYAIILIELDKFSQLTNPLMASGSVPFRDIQESCKTLLPKLISKSKKTRRRAKLHRVAGYSLVVCYTVVAAALLVVAVHSMVGTVMAPGLTMIMMTTMGGFTGGVGGVLRRRKGDGRRRWWWWLVVDDDDDDERLGEQLDAAAKGIYYLVRDFDTMSRLVSRLYVEVEHRKGIVEMCVRVGGGGSRAEMLMEVVREFHAHDSFFLEQLEELEDHIYLCLLSIKRSRMHVIQQITGFLSLYQH